VLLDMRVLTADYGDALATLSHDLADLDRVHESWRQMGRKPVIVDSFVDSEGTLRHRLRANPLLRERLRLEHAVRSWLVEFGLTPAARAKVARPAAPEDQFDQFLAGPLGVVPPRRSRSE
jgi:hypothetical protein